MEQSMQYELRINTNKLVFRISLVMVIILSLISVLAVINTGIIALQFLGPIVVISAIPMVIHKLNKESKYSLYVLIGIIIILCGTIVIIDPNHAKLFYLLAVVVAGLSFNTKVIRNTMILTLLTLIISMTIVDRSITVITGLGVPIMELLIGYFVLTSNTKLLQRLFQSISEDNAKKQEAIEKLGDSIDVLNTSNKTFVDQFGQMVAASQEVAADIISVTEGSSQQKDISHKAESGYDKIEEVVNEVDSQSVHALDGLRQINAETENGRETIGSTVGIMNKLRETTLSNQNKIVQLKESTSNIVELTSLISSIADQTNLLALNARIEAARAGEAGKGFAVVADEIAKLAFETTSASSQISELLDAIDANVESVSDASEESTGNVLSSIESINRSKTLFELIDDLTQKSVDNLAVISSNMGEVKELVIISRDELKESVQISEQVNTDAQSISSAAEELAASIMSLNETVGDLGDLTGELGLLAKDMQ